MSAISQKRAAFQVLQFLKESLPSLKQDDQEGIEVASKFPDSSSPAGEELH
jgi:hypothetical protein